MKIIISRHGNTFDPGDPVVWTGSSNDLELVAKGIEQANKLADTLLIENIKPRAVYCGPLKRTKKYAQIVTEKLHLDDPIIDSRLNELDYGNWTGLTNKEVEEKYGSEEQNAWGKSSIWPANSNWTSSETEVVKSLSELVVDLDQNFKEEDIILLISSNGKIRYFLKLIENEFEKRVINNDFKVKTGNICVLELKNKQLEVKSWNQEPSKLITT